MKPWQMMRRFGEALSGGDLPWANVVSLAHFDGANGSTTLVDEKGGAYTAVGSAQISTAQSRFGGSSLRLPGSGSYAYKTDSSLDLSGSDYTISGWAYLDTDSYSGVRAIFSTFIGQGNGRIIVHVDTSGTVEVTEQDGSGTNTAFATSATNTFPRQQWVHFELSKMGTTVRLFINGQKVAEVSSPVRATFAGHIRIGLLDSGAYEWPWIGWVDDFRVVKGVALHVADFTPPTEAYPDS